MEISSLLASLFIDYAGKHGIDDDRLLSGCSYSKDILNDPHAWIDYNSFLLLAGNLQQIEKNKPDILYNLGSKALENNNFKFIKIIAANMGNIALIYDLMPLLFNRLVRIGELEVKESKNKRIKIEYNLDLQYKPFIELSNILRGMLETLPVSAGFQETKVIMHITGQGAVYEMVSPNFTLSGYGKKIKNKFKQLYKKDDFDAWKELYSCNQQAAPSIKEISGISELISHQEMNRRILELEEENNRLKNLDTFKSEFFANISREFKSPLMLLISPVQSMLKGEWGGFNVIQKNQLDVMHYNALRLLKLINSFLDLARIDAHKMGLNLVKCDLPSFIKGVMASITGLSEQSGIKMIFICNHTIPPVYIDPDKIEKVLLNLLYNSIKYTDTGGKIDIICKLHEKKFIKIIIKDTGIGMSPDFFSRIFDRHSHYENSKKYSGIGLGLAIVKEFVNLHKGEVSGQSALGKGTTIEVTIPILAEEHFKTMQEESGIEIQYLNEERGKGAFFDDWSRYIEKKADNAAFNYVSKPISRPPDIQRPYKVLIAEHDDDMLYFMNFQLQEEFEILSAKTGEEALKAIREHTPDIVVSEIILPQSDGYELCREIRKDKAIMHIPVILITENADISVKLEAIKYGDACLVKPYDCEELRAKIRSLITVRKLEKEVQARSEELEKALNHLQETEAQLVHSEKMAAVGILAAGVAHEINNPISFAKGSANNLLRYLEEMKPFLDKYPRNTGDYGQIEELIDCMQKAISIISTGLERTKQIVIDLMDFVRKDSSDFQLVDINSSLDATLRILRHELWGRRINVHKEFTDIGLQPGIGGQLNQVFLNVLMNAVQAIDQKGDIWIKTAKDDKNVMVHIRDNGHGIKKEHMDKIFQPFFTTKDVGKGIGLGLSLCYKIIVETHKGELKAVSEEGNGTEFLIAVPAVNTR